MVLLHAAIHERFSRDLHHYDVNDACGSSALDILNERYASGEINQAEYEERRRVLRS